jgi:hypothetical protein
MRWVQGVTSRSPWIRHWMSASSKGMRDLAMHFELDRRPWRHRAQSILPKGMTRLRSTIFGRTRSITTGGPSSSSSGSGFDVGFYVDQIEIALLIY